MEYLQTQWSLADLFPGFESPDLETAFDQVEELVSAFEGVRAGLSATIDAERFTQILSASEAISRILHRIYSFAGLSFAANTQDPAAQSLMTRIEQFSAEMQNRTLFFSLWWRELDQANASRLLAVAGNYRYYLEELRAFKPHALSEPEEKIINLKNVTGVSALVTLYDSIVNRYVFKLQVGETVRDLTAAELMSYRYSSDPELRARSYQEQFRVVSADGPILGQMYLTLLRDWHNENLSLRKFPSPISVRNLSNDIPDEAVNTLLEVAQKNTGIFQRYFKLKAKLLGMQKLRRYDLYAPVSHAVKKYDFSTSAQMVFDSFSAFDPALTSLARRVFDQGHLDGQIRKGKDSGAFCWSVAPEETPYVMLNFQGQARDVAVMAHELGHAVHSMLAGENSFFTYSASLPLAETASTFAEMMLTDKLVSEEMDEGVKRDILFKQVDDAYVTIQRQVYLALFEKRAHELAQKNASVDEISEAYLENLREQFGDSITLTDEFRWEWVSIPHIYHTPFYVYAYAFGQLLVLSLYQQFQREGKPFKSKYLKILTAGGSEAPAAILAEAGIDIRSAPFWQGGFDVLSKLVDELEKLD